MVKLYLIAPQKHELLQGNPYALLYLAEWARRNSDVSIGTIQNIEQVKEDEATFVGISVTTPTYQKGLDVARRLKQKNPEIKTILGGCHTKGQGRFIIEHPEIDFVVEGEGEKALIRILNGEKNKIISGEPLSVQEYDSIRIKDFLDLNPDYFKTVQQLGRLNYITTRGCLYSCSFCASSEKLSAKSVQKVVEDLEILAQEGFNQISIQDNYFGYSHQRIRKICNEILERKIKLDWDCQTRVESMQDENLLRLMAYAGCSAVYLGTENFHPEVLKRMNKTSKPHDYLIKARNAIQNMLSAGIKPNLNLQLGLLGENEEIRQTNITTLKKLARIARQDETGIELSPNLNVIYPGTPDFYALIKEDFPEDIFEEFTKWEEEDGIEIKDFLRKNHFIHGAGGIPLGILNYKKLRQGEFEINKTKVKEVENYLLRIGKIKGVIINQN